MLQTLHDLSVEVVDLRAEKGHAWEDAGVEPFRRAGVEVAHIGVSVVLGRPDVSVEAIAHTLSGLQANGLPLKVFASAELGRDREAHRLAVRQVAHLIDLTDNAGVLVETHHGYAELDALGRLYEESGCGVLLDTLGLTRLGATAATVAPYGQAVRGVQVKGYDEQDIWSRRHDPLRLVDQQRLSALLTVPGRAVPVTVESRAGTLAEDVATLRHLLTVPGPPDGVHP